MWVFTPLTALQGEKRLPQLLASQRVPVADLPQLLSAVHHGTGGCTEGCIQPGSAPSIHRVQCSLCLFVAGMHVSSSTVLPRIQEGFFSTKLLLATAVALWSAVGAQQEVLGEHRVMLEQRLCYDLGLNSNAHKVGAKTGRGWVMVGSPMQDSLGRLHCSCPALSPPASPAQPAPHQGGVSSSVLDSSSRDTPRSQVSWPATPPRLKPNRCGLDCP